MLRVYKLPAGTAHGMIIITEEAATQREEIYGKVHDRNVSLTFGQRGL